MQTFITSSTKETKRLGEGLASQFDGGQVIALSGDLGSGKTTFTQGLLKGLGIKGVVTSPTFAIIKQYKPTTNNQQQTTKKRKKSSVVSCKLLVYHIDAYRVTNKDILNLGWREIVTGKNSIIIVEWADRIKKIIPRRAIWIKFKWMDKNKRRVIFLNKSTLKIRRKK